MATPADGDRDGTLSIGTGSTVYSLTNSTINRIGRDYYNITNVINTSDNHKPDHVISVSRVVDGLLALMNSQHDLFRKLSHAKLAWYDAPSPDHRRPCTTNTRLALMAELMAWATDATKPKIYWLTGMAGTGKTTVSYSFSEHLEKSKMLGATFFCSRLVDECTRVERIFPTIAYWLARRIPAMAGSLLELLRKDPDAANHSLNKQFTDLVVNPLTDAGGTFKEQLIIVIDALDECADQEQVKQLLSVIFHHSPKLLIKIFITSRPEQAIKLGFGCEAQQNYSKFILHDIDKAIVNADIRLYIVERLTDMIRGRDDFSGARDDWPPEDKVKILAERADKSFIYAKTVCDYIGKHTGNVLRRLENVTDINVGRSTLGLVRLDELYRNILDHAILDEDEESEVQRQILAAVISLRNPLSITSLGTLLDIDAYDIRPALASLHSVLSVPESLDGCISTFHATFPDFLTNRKRSQNHFLDSSKCHQQLAIKCLTQMSRSLQENICNLAGNPTTNEIASDTIKQHIPDGLQYSCLYWASHLIATRKEETLEANDLYNQLDEFLRKHCLHWMECLSLVDRLEVAIEGLRAMEGWALVRDLHSVGCKHLIVLH
jgi:hypothetical protein